MPRLCPLVTYSLLWCSVKPIVRILVSACEIFKMGGQVHVVWILCKTVSPVAIMIISIAFVCIITTHSNSLTVKLQIQIDFCVLVILWHCTVLYNVNVLMKTICNISASHSVCLCAMNSLNLKEIFFIIVKILRAAQQKGLSELGNVKLKKC